MTIGQVSTKTIEFVILLCVLVISVLVYMPALDGPLLLDDYPRLGTFFSNSDLNRDQLTNQIVDNPSALKRPVSMLSFIGNYTLSRSELFGWKLTNLLIHLVCGLAWFCFMKLVERILRIRYGMNCCYLALVVTTIWLLHPLQVSTAMYLVQRMAQLSALFIALGMCSYAWGRLRQIRGQSGKLHLYSSIIIFLPLAVLSKENGVVLPLLILTTELFLFRFAASPLLRKELNLFLITAVLLPVTAGLIILISYFDTLILQGYQGRPFSLGERLLTEFRVICMYLGQILWPAPSSMRFFYESLAVSDSLFRPITTALSFIVILMLLTLAWIVRNKMPLLTYGILFYFVSISVESSIFPLELAFEHRNYIGILGIAIAVYSVATQFVSRSLIRYVSYIALVGILSMTTTSRAATWSSKTSFYNYYYRVNPESQRVVSMLAEELTNQGRYEHALGLLASISANGARLQSLYIRCLRGDSLYDLDYQRLAENIDSAVGNYELTAIIEIANLGLDEQCNLNLEEYQLFLSEISDKTYRSAADRFKIRMYQAHYLWQMGKHQEALSLLESIANSDYTSPIPLFLAAEWSLDTNDRKSAIDYLAQAEQLARTKNKDYSAYENGIKKRLRLLDENK